MEGLRGRFELGLLWCLRDVVWWGLPRLDLGGKLGQWHGKPAALTPLFAGCLSLVLGGIGEEGYYRCIDYREARGSCVGETTRLAVPFIGG